MKKLTNKISGATINVKDAEFEKMQRKGALAYYTIHETKVSAPIKQAIEENKAKAEDLKPQPEKKEVANPPKQRAKKPRTNNEDKK